MSDTTSSGEEDVLRTMGDADCRAILAAAADTPQTVSELVDRCEISTATAYRKIDELVEAGLLEEHTRISPNGRNPSEYRLRTQTVRIDITEAGRLDVTCSLSEPKTATDDVADRWRRALSVEPIDDERRFDESEAVYPDSG